MTHDELYFFDNNGYLLLENVIPEELRGEGVERSRALQYRLKLKFPDQESLPGARPGGSLPQICSEEPVFLRMALLPGLLSKVVALVPSPKLKTTWLSYSLLGGRVPPHGNHTPIQISQNYSFADGKPLVTSLIFILALEDIPEDGGALEVIPGSHKSNLVPPAEDSSILQSMWRSIPQPAGSVLMLTHDIYHRSLCRKNYVRRTLHVGYAPGCMAHGDNRDERMFDRFHGQTPEGSWCRYLLRRPGSEVCKQPETPIEDEFAAILQWRPAGELVHA